MVRILFVCLGNICRSPMAEAIFRDLVKNENLSDKITVDSSGIGDYHLGEVPHPGTTKILDDAGVSYEGMKATKISKKDWSHYDYIIVMDNQNMEALRKAGKKKKHVMVAKLMDFVNESKGMDIPDPYFTGDFEYTYQLVSEGCKQLLHYIKAKHIKNKGEMKMGRNKLIIGAVIGAAVGGAVALADRDTREYVKLKIDDAKNGTSFVIEHPTETVQSLRNGFNSFNKMLAQGTDSAINALDQVEKTLDRVTADKNKNELMNLNDDHELQVKQ